MGWVAAVLAGTVAVGAQAADKPVLAPPGAWVKPAALPAADAKLGDAAVRVLLLDQQVRLSPRGDESYVESVTRIQTPQGLASMGTISLPWRPETMTLTVHKLHVVRAGKVIDLLAGGREFTVLRRENDLEHAVLDGVLTATIQPEGLQVGDIVDMAFTMKSLDPALRGISQGGLGGFPLVPIDHVRARAMWAGDMSVKWRSMGDLPPIAEATKAGVHEIGWSADDVQPPVLPRGAPLRYAMTRSVQITGLVDWPALSTLFAPLYAKAATLGAESPLQTEVARIKAASPDPTRRAELALALVQDQVRYVMLGMADGNLVPASADQTWSRRFGDCKGKTALLLGLLHALGIAAEPALVSARLGDGLDERLPMIGLFDHVLVRATIGGKVYWLDGTRTGDRRLADIDTPPFRWALPVRLDKGATLERLEVQAPTRPFIATTIRIDASKGLTTPAPAHIERRFRGDGATAMKLAVGNLAADARDRELKQFWRGEYAFLDPQTVTTRFDDATGEETLVADGTAKLTWSDRRYEADDSGIGYDADFTRDAGPNRDAPYAVRFPTYSVTREEILLPNGGKDFTVTTKDIVATAAGTEFRRRGRVEHGAFVAETSIRSVAPEFPAKDAVAAQATIRGFKQEGLFVHALASYRPTVADAAAGFAAPPEPKTAAEFAARADAALARNDWEAAGPDARRAIALDPRNLVGHVALGVVLSRQHDLTGARAQLAAALAIDPHFAWAHQVMAYVEQAEKRPDAALAEVDRALADGRRVSLVYAQRGWLLAAMGRKAEAAAAYAQALHDQPANADLHLARANALYGAGQRDAAAAEADALVAAAPDQPDSWTYAGAIYARTGRKEESDRAFARSLAVRPTVTAYLTRVEYRPPTDIAGRRGDIDAALQLEPGHADGLRLLAGEQVRTGDYRGALATLDRALAAQPKEGGLLLSRSIAHARLNDLAAARADLAAARALNPQAGPWLNNICWSEATAGVLLDDALAVCDVAVKGRPQEAAFLDSRGFVLLRLGRVPDAIRDFDAALAVRPKQAGSLYARGIARLRAGDKAGGEADLAAAKAIDAQVAAEYAGYGVTA